MHKGKLILLLNASPRVGGNTDIVLEKIRQTIGGRARVTKIDINNLNFKPCQVCGGCDRDECCILQDDLRPIYKEIIESDAIVFGSPIYFGSLTAQAKMLIDRMQPFWLAKIRKGKTDIKRKKGFLILIAAAAKNEFFENAKQIVRLFFQVINTQYCGELLFAKIDRKGEILDFPGLEKQVARIALAALSD
ncbi:MAG: flavodoxin family protein [Candidatus Omnitrophota bacterium]